MPKIILVSATTLEHGGLKELNGIPVFQVGLGKISAASNLAEIICNENPDIVINFGSCGNLKDNKVGTVLEVGVVHNNIDGRPLAPYGCTPFTDLCELKLSESGVSLFTTDQFYDEIRTDYAEKYMEMIQKCDIVDMECYALAQVCKEKDIKFHSFKWVSDDGDSSKWKQNAEIGFDNFKELFKQRFIENG